MISNPWRSIAQISEYRLSPPFLCWSFDAFSFEETMRHQSYVVTYIHILSRGIRSSLYVGNSQRRIKPSCWLEARLVRCKQFLLPLVRILGTVNVINDEEIVLKSRECPAKIVKVVVVISKRINEISVNNLEIYESIRQDEK